MKRILILSNIDGGLYNFRRELMKRLCDDGNEVFCAFSFGEKRELIEKLGCKCINVPVSRRGTNPIQDLILLFKYIKLIRKLKPDAILTYTIKPNIYGGIAASLLKVPYFTNITGLGTAIENGGFMQKMTLWLYKIGLKKSRRVFFQNSSNMDFMVKKRVVGDNFELLPGSGVNLDIHSYEEYPEDEKNIVFLIIGRIMKDKGTAEILEAAKIIKAENPDVTFRFVGGNDGSFEERIAEAVKAGLVEHVGRQPEVHSFLKNAHATLHASYHEGMSNALLESAATGRPIVATNVPGCRETFDDGESGIAFNARDVDSLVSAVRKFLALSHEEKEKMGRAGREKMEREFNRDIIVNKYLKLLSEL